MGYPDDVLIGSNLRSREIIRHFGVKTVEGLEEIRYMNALSPPSQSPAV